MRHAARHAPPSTSASGTRRATYLYDVVDGENGDDHRLPAQPGLRISLPHPVLDEARWAPCWRWCGEAAHAGRPALALARSSRLQAALLWRPARARCRVSPGHRLGLADRALHRCVAEGPSDDSAGARGFLEALLPHLDHACVGSISEIFDAEAPFTPRGCIAQAWSVAEALRCWVKTAA